MPTFDYKCLKCGTKYEELVLPGFPKLKCPKCGSTRAKKVYNTAPAFKIKPRYRSTPRPQKYWVVPGSIGKE